MIWHKLMAIMFVMLRFEAAVLRRTVCVVG
jgi:hypothetical protein